MPRLPTVKILWENSLVKNVSSCVTVSIIQTNKKKSENISALIYKLNYD